MNLPECRLLKTHKEIVRIMVFSIPCLKDGQATSNTKARAPLPGFSRVIWDEWGKKGVRMDTKALKKQMGAAIAMVLVAAVALGSATFAWFVSNNTVKAETATISAQSNAPFLQIDKTDIAEGSGTNIQFTEPAETKLFPAQVVKNTTDTMPLFQSAYASKAGAATELTNSRYNVGDADTAANKGFALKETFKIGTHDEKAGSFNNLTVSKVAVKTGADSAEGLKDAISVLLVCGDKWAVYKADPNGNVLTQYADKTTTIECTAINGVLSEKIAAGVDHSVEIKAYVFYDGSQDNVKTSNLTNLTNCNVELTFTATPVNTQGVEVNAGNDANAA